MMKNLLLFTLVLLLGININAQNALISEKKVPLKTYPFSDPNPIPLFGKIYPYFRFDGFSVNGSMQEWKMIELENDYIKLWIVPDVGGKIWGAVEKSTGKEFIYYNHAVKFRDIAMRGAWTSGGIEINFGVIGHAPTCSTPVDYLIRKNADGSVSCFVGAIDLTSRTRWTTEVNLQKDKAYFTTRTRWDNSSLLEQSYYHWMNLGVKSAGNLEYVFPGNYFVGHNGEHSPWPVDEAGHEISFYDKNNFGGAKSYHIWGELTDFYGGFWHNDNFGFGHYSTYDDKPGKKIFIWGLGGSGDMWEKLLTDTDGQYTEVQSGRMFNQASPGSSNTPFKNRGIASGTTDEWTEYWLPVKGTQGMKSSHMLGSVNLEQKENMVNVWFCPNEITNSSLQVRNGKDVVFTKEIHADPMQTVSGSFAYAGDYKNLTVWLGNILLYDADREKYQIKRPVETPEDFSWETAFGHFEKGKELEFQRQYKQAEGEYQKALEIDKYYIPALTGMANIAFRKTDYAASLGYSLKALSIDTYNADANMIYGLSAMTLGDTTSAIDGFSIASQDISQRTAAYNGLSSIFLKKGDFNKALSYAEKSLQFNQLGSYGIQLKVLSLRKLGRQNESSSELSKLEMTDPLNHFIRIEKYLVDPSPENKVLVQKFITNEFPHETYLEYAIWYFSNGQISDAQKILEIAPANSAIVVLWQSYLNHLTGKEQAASSMLSEALKISPKFVLPFRMETLAPLAWAQLQSKDWKLKYYTSLIYFGSGATEKGKAIWDAIGQEPDFYPFYIARSRLSDAGSPQARTDIDKAVEFAGNDWQAGLNASKYYQGQGNIQKAVDMAKTIYMKYPKNFVLGMQYATTLEQNKNYLESIKVLKATQLLPAEGASQGITLWRKVNNEYARELMNAGKYKQALVYIDMAREWPENLGSGKPYQVNEVIEDTLALECYKKLNDQKSVRLMEDKIKNAPPQSQRRRP